MIYRVWSEAEPGGCVRRTSDALTDCPPRDCTVRLDEVCECASCGRPIRYRDAHPSLDLHVAITAASGYHEDGSDYPALICAECAREEGQDVPEPAGDAERIEALERNVGRLVGAMRELAEVVRRMLGAYVVGETETITTWTESE